MIRALPLFLLLLASAQEPRRPNVLLIITDDQAYGDLGCHGNPHLKTPNIDSLAQQSFVFDTFYVCPVCSPTRAQLLTGRYYYRTGIVDTFLGRSMMHADEVTLAERLGAAGYKTGIFGKWHLGDNYPLRAQDQGFRECVTIRGGGIGQPSDPPGGDHYTDATMYRNGTAFKSQGYCTDVFTDATLDFMTAHKNEPFFAYVPFNAPHTPLEAPEGYLKPYREEKLPDGVAKLYAMVANIDNNVGRLLSKLDELRIARDTIVIFMSDNGPEKERYNAGLRGLKGTVYDGGIRVPFFLRWPQAPDPPRKVTGLATALDIVPTILALTKVADTAKVPLDGASLLPSLSTGQISGEKTYFPQWHRGDVPEKYRACASMEPTWKLVWSTPLLKPQLFDRAMDPLEKDDVAADHADVVDRLTKAYDAWFESVRSTRHFAPPRIVLGTEHEDPTVLTRQDWRGPHTISGAVANGSWMVTIAKDTTFDVTLRFKAPAEKTTVTYTGGAKPVDVEVEAGSTSVTLPAVPHVAGNSEISATIKAAKPHGPDYVELKRAQ
jgi:arylsulfatase A-like enzyme